MMAATLPKHLVVRGGMYYVRKDGKRISTGIAVPYQDQAERRMHEIIKDLNDGKHGWNRKPVVVPTLNVYADLYLRTHSTLKKKNSAESDRVALLRWRVVYGEHKLDALVRTDFVAYTTWRQGGSRPDGSKRRDEDGPAGANNTIIHELAVLHTMLNAAVGDGLLTKNPMFKVPKPEAETRDRVLTLDEQDEVFEGLYPEYQRLGTVFLGTGLRANELLKLEPHDVKFDDGYIDLPKHKAKGGKKGRLIPLYPEVVTALKDQIAARETGQVTTVQRPGGCRRKNKTAIFNMGRESALQIFHDAATAKNVESFTIHDLRRTFGTRMAEAGMPIKHLSLVMGHSDIAITAKYYIHIGDDNLKKTMLAIDLGLPGSVKRRRAKGHLKAVSTKSVTPA